MRCHYIYVKKKKILIPECWQVVHTNDISQCTCKPQTFEQFEKEKYNDVLGRFKTENEELQKEVFRLRRIVNKLHK